MKYKIEIWQHQSLTATYENDDIKEILKWYKENWKWSWDYGHCAFSVYENGRLLSFKEATELGFYDFEY